MNWVSEMKYLTIALLVFGLVSGVARADTPLIEAIESENYEEAIRLIEGGADINAGDSEHGVLPLSRAAARNSVDVAKVLISKGADVNAKDKHDHTPLYFAAKIDSVEVANLLISKGADINAKDVKAICHCIVPLVLVQSILLKR